MNFLIDKKVFSMTAIQELAQEVAKEMCLVQRIYTRVMEVKTVDGKVSILFDVEGKQVSVDIFAKYLDYYSLSDIVDAIVELYSKQYGVNVYLN